MESRERHNSGKADDDLMKFKERLEILAALKVIKDRIQDPKESLG